MVVYSNRISKVLGNMAHNAHIGVLRPKVLLINEKLGIREKVLGRSSKPLGWFMSQKD